MIEKINLDRNSSDAAADILDWAGNVCEILGVPIVPALFSNLSKSIPNQQIDRIVDFCKILQNMINSDKLKESPERVSLIGDGFYAAAVTPYEEIVKRIAYVVANGLSQEKMNGEEYSKIIHAVKNISDLDAIILHYYKCKRDGKESIQNFEEKHPHIWPIQIGGLLDLWDENPHQYTPKELEENSDLIKKCKRSRDLSEIHLSSLGMLKKDISQIYNSVEQKGIEDLSETIDQIRSVLNAEYAISDFGLVVLDAIKKPSNLKAY